MIQKSERHRNAVERKIKDIRRQTLKRYSSEEKIMFVTDGLSGPRSLMLSALGG
jgi:transposase